MFLDAANNPKEQVLFLRFQVKNLHLCGSNHSKTKFRNSHIWKRLLLDYRYGELPGDTPRHLTFFLLVLLLIFDRYRKYKQI